MKISLIGMSGTGKTHWSKKLEEKGFLHICCDSLVEEKLDRELKPLGYRGIKDVAKWMGQPFDKRYSQTSQRYLCLEKEVMKEIINNLKNNVYKNKNVVIDTTGSVVYTGKRIMGDLSKLTKIIYLDTCRSMRENMLKLYLNDPKPVIWGNVFEKRSNETEMQALARCYPKLLQYRTKKYKEFADISLDYFSMRKPDFTVTKLHNIINHFNDISLK